MVWKWETTLGWLNTSYKGLLRVMKFPFLMILCCFKSGTEMAATLTFQQRKQEVERMA